MPAAVFVAAFSSLAGMPGGDFIILIFLEDNNLGLVFGITRETYSTNILGPSDPIAKTYSLNLLLARAMFLALYLLA